MEPPSYFPVVPGKPEREKNGAFQAQPPGEFGFPPVQPGISRAVALEKPRVFPRNRKKRSFLTGAAREFSGSTGKNGPDFPTSAFPTFLRLSELRLTLGTGCPSVVGELTHIVNHPIDELIFSEIILVIHDQKNNDWMCWCYSIATMMHNSLNLLIRGAFQGGQIRQSEHDEIKKKLNDENFHKQLRNELAMVVFPIPMNTDPDVKQFSYYVNLNMVVDRVSRDDAVFLEETKFVYKI